jgi:hypothetical protein
MARDGEFGRMAALRGDEVVSVDLVGVEGVKTVDLALLEIAKRFFT